MGKETLSVSAIKNGTVIDHIKAGKALQIVPLLDLTSGQQQVTVGINLRSLSLGQKILLNWRIKN